MTSAFSKRATRRQSRVLWHPDAMRFAALDVGSNSLHLIIAQADVDGSVTTLWRAKEMVGLGRNSFPSHRLSRESMHSALQTLARFQRMAQSRHCETIVAVATSAVREARNGGAFIRQVRRRLGLDVRVISAREEARMIYLGVRQAMDLSGGPHLIIDVGGGSVELIVGDRRRTLLLESRKLGAARMAAAYVRSDPIAPRELKALGDLYARQLGPLCEEIAQLHPVNVIGTSGTMENLAAMCAAEGAADNGAPAADGRARVIERERFERILAQLVSSRAEQRSRMQGLDPARQDQIVAAAVLVAELFRRLAIRRIQWCPGALREGLLVDYLARHLPDLNIRRDVPDPRHRSVLDLARRCDWHETHSLQVTRIAMELFDQLKPLHHLNDDDDDDDDDRDRFSGGAARQLIQYGAMLHDIGWHIARNAHHKHSMYLILNGELKGFSPQEVQVIANIARYHRKAPPRRKHAMYASLPRRARRIVDVGAAILRICDGLDRSHSSAVRSVRCRIHRDRVEMVIDGRGDVELELWAARGKCKWFRDVFGRPVVLRARPGTQKERPWTT